MQATAEIPDSFGCKTVKGFHTFSEAWAQSYKESKTYTIKLNGDVIADSKNGFNFDKLDRKTYQFQGNGGSNNTSTYKGRIDARYCVPDFAWGISGGSK
nr:hypothetical protein [uncultured Ruminococcus sp.]